MGHARATQLELGLTSDPSSPVLPLAIFVGVVSTLSGGRVLLTGRVIWETQIPQSSGYWLKSKQAGAVQCLTLQ